MNKEELKNMLEEVAAGKLSPNEAVNRIKLQPYDDLGFAKIDTHRGMRQGAEEVIYGAGKTTEQLIKITEHILSGGEKSVLITRLSEASADALGQRVPLFYDKMSKIGIAGTRPENKQIGNIVIATGGTSDIPVAEEHGLAAITIPV